MTGSIKTFYLMTQLKQWEYVKLKLRDIPQEITDEYQLQDKVTQDSHVYIKIRRGMDGLLEAGLLAQQLLEERLAKHGYYQSQLVPGMWSHKTRPITFSLVVDNFGVKYVHKDGVAHLMSAWKQHYKMTKDWKGERYIGMHLRWDYAAKKVHIAMPGYVAKALTQFHHEPPRRQQGSP